MGKYKITKTISPNYLTGKIDIDYPDLERRKKERKEKMNKFASQKGLLRPKAKTSTKGKSPRVNVKGVINYMLS